MKLRRLKRSDAPLMLEWMHDQNVTRWMDTCFAEKKLEDCNRFIENSETDTDIHLAIADSDTDQYMGTVSLKNIDQEKGIAEFAITIREQAMGKGYSRDAMAEMLRIGMTERGLHMIYWYVNRNNNRALRFYDKNGYLRVNALPVEGLDDNKYVYYSVCRDAEET